MNALTVDPKTGFLESKGASGHAFDAPRKVAFLEMAERYWNDTGLMPDLESLAKAANVSPWTLEVHLRNDEKFAAAYRSIRLKGKWKLEGKMYEYALTKGGYMDRITWLRHEFPEEYNPEQRIVHSTDSTRLKGLLDGASQIFDAEIVPNSDNTSTQAA